MTASVGCSLQQGIYQALAEDPQVTGLLARANIYGDAPQNASFPYLTFGQTTERDWSTGAEDGSEHTVTLHVWSRAGGKKQTNEIIDVIRDALNAVPLTIADHTLVKLKHEFSEARHDKDGETYHGIVRYRAITEPLS
ncbi:MAG: DUF3168 domain-containing protein [Hyphomicrobiales bacterium]|nr:DUF3168 domain-containing protein [Hyphomicrobiales bacterium]